MNALIAIVLDTWRQSRQQWVFLLMLGLLALLTGAALILPEAEEPTLQLWRGGPRATQALRVACDPIEKLRYTLATLCALHTQHGHAENVECVGCSRRVFVPCLIRSCMMSAHPAP